MTTRERRASRRDPDWRLKKEFVEQRIRFASLMSLAADDAGGPMSLGSPSAHVAYLEWSTCLAVANSQEAAEIIERATVPRRGWGEAPPYQL
jgi:hemoglobin